MANTKSFESPVHLLPMEHVGRLESRTFLKGETIDPSKLCAVCVLKSDSSGAVEEWFVSEEKEYLAFTHRGGDFFGLEQIFILPDAPRDSKTFFRVRQDADILLLKKSAISVLPEYAQLQILAAFLKTAQTQRIHAVRIGAFYTAQSRERAQELRDIRMLCATQERRLQMQEKARSELEVENVRLKKTIGDLRIMMNDLREWKARAKQAVRKMSDATLRVHLP